MASDSLPKPLAEAIRNIKHDREHGASWLARAAAQALSDATASIETLPPGETQSLLASAHIVAIHIAAQRIVASRPSMAAVANTAARIWWAGTPERAGDDPLARLRAFHAEASHISDAWASAADTIASHVGALLPDHVTIYTISRSGTVEHALRWLATAGKLGKVIIAESRPGDEGVALAKSLAGDERFRAAGVSITLAADAASGLLMPEVDAVLIGADSVRADGDVINKVGTHTLALIAHEHGKPVYALCESLKIASPDWPQKLETGATTALLARPIPGVTLDTTLFEATPARLIHAIITEAGPLDHDALARLADEAKAALASV